MSKLLAWEEMRDAVVKLKPGASAERGYLERIHIVQRPRWKALSRYCLTEPDAWVDAYKKLSRSRALAPGGQKEGGE